MYCGSGDEGVMTVSATSKVSTDPSVKAIPGRRTTPRRCSRTPVEDVLPAALRAELRVAVESVDAITPALVDDIDNRFHVEGQYGITRLRLRNYLRRLRGTGQDHLACSPPDGNANTAKDWRQRIGAHRERQASVASILDATFGPMAKCSPELWDRRAYLMLVGLVYERLAIAEIELPTAELVALAKVLAEGRRADVRQREKTQAKIPDEHGDPHAGDLPERFADIVRNVYGANFHDPEDSHGNGQRDDTC